jgi:hypothetical protein
MEEEEVEGGGGGGGGTTKPGSEAEGVSKTVEPFDSASKGIRQWG